MYASEKRKAVLISVESEELLSVANTLFETVAYSSVSEFMRQHQDKPCDVVILQSSEDLGTADLRQLLTAWIRIPVFLFSDEQPPEIADQFMNCYQSSNLTSLPDITFILCSGVCEADRMRMNEILATAKAGELEEAEKMMEELRYAAVVERRGGVVWSTPAFAQDITDKRIDPAILQILHRDRAHIVTRDVDVWIQTDNGRAIQLQITFVPVQTDKGRHYALICRDPYEFYQIRERHLAMNRAIDEIGDLLILYWPGSEKCYCSGGVKDTLGFSQDLTATMSVFDFFARESRPIARDAVREATSLVGSGVTFPATMLTAHRRRVPVEVVARALYKLNEKTVLLAFAIQDVRSRRQMERIIGELQSFSSVIATNVDLKQVPIAASDIMSLILQNASQHKSARAADQSKTEALIGYLASGPKSIPQIMRRLGVKRRMAFNYIRKIREQGVVLRVNADGKYEIEL